MKQRPHTARHLLWRSLIAAGYGVALGTGLYPFATTWLGGRLVGRGGPRMTPRPLAREWATSSWMTAVRPMGLAGLPVWRPRDGGRPVILVHGLFMGRMNFAFLAQNLAWAGHGPSLGFEYWTLAPILKSAARLGCYIEDLRRAGAPPVDLVGHSMGGLLCRAYVALLGGAPHVRRLVTLGSPFRGTPLSPPLPWASSLEDIREGSDFGRALAAAPWPADIPVLNVRSTADGLVPRFEAAVWSQGREVTYDDLGHMSLLASRRVARDVIAAFDAPNTTTPATV